MWVFICFNIITKSNIINMKPALISFLLICFAFPLFSQSSSVDVVILKNGNRLEGEIIQYEQHVKLILKQDGGGEIEIKDENIEQIIQGVKRGENPPNTIFKSKKKTYPKTRNSGTYFISQLAFAMGRSDEDGLALGAGTAFIAGKQFKPGFGVGVGIGLDNYARRGETIYPAFLDLRSYLPFKTKSGSYYATLNVGYGFAFARKSIGINEAEGGYLIHPAIGFRTTTKEGVDVNIDAGMKLQKASFSRDLFTGDVEVRDLTFQRFAVRVGITLWGKK